MIEPHYHINLFWSAEDECWNADVPDLKSCSAFGDTPEEAIAEARLAMEGWLEVAREHNMPIPEARYRPAPRNLRGAMNMLRASHRLRR